MTERDDTTSPGGSHPSEQPPPARPAPERLRRSIGADLHRAERRPLTSRRVIGAVAGVAAALVLIVGALGAVRLVPLLEAVPAEIARPGLPPTPARPTPATTSSTPTGPAAETYTSRALTSAEAAADLGACTGGVADDQEQPEGERHRGEWRTVAARTIPVINSESAVRSARYMIIDDDQQRLVCVDGELWSVSFGPHREDADEKYAVESRGSLTVRCEGSAPGFDRVTNLTGWRMSPRVRSFSVATTINGVVRRVDVTLTVAPQEQGPNVAALFDLRGAAVDGDTEADVAFRDADGALLDVVTRGSENEVVTTSDRITIEGCGAPEGGEPTDDREASERPASDADGVARCSAEITARLADRGETFDVGSAEVAVTVSTPDQWGAVFSHDGRYVACSLFPTQEISPVRSAGPGTSEADFHWALNPFPGQSQGQTFWAAGRLPGVLSVVYAFADGRTVTAAIGADGHWLAMARTDTVFDDRERVDEWPPVTVTATTATEVHRYTIAWNEKTMCNQISHGC